MKLAPDAIDATDKYILGGSEFSELFMASLKDKADEELKRIPNGPWHGKFIELLAAAVDIDKEKSGRRLGFDNNIPDGESMDDWPYYDRVSGDIVPDGHVLYEP